MVAIGLRCKAAMPPLRTQPSLAHTVGVSLSTIFMDHLDSDVEHLHRINKLLKSFGKGEEPMRHVDVLHIAPSVDLSEIAREYAHRMPVAIRYLLSGWGADSSSAEVLSYLLFDSKYTSALEELGYRDAAAYKDEFEAWLNDTPTKAEPAPKKPAPTEVPVDVKPAQEGARASGGPGRAA
jgi:NTE family protein